MNPNQNPSLPPSDAQSDERKFLHDLASPLAAALFTLDTLSEEAKLAGGAAAVEADTLARAQAALVQMHRLLVERRAVLIRQVVKPRFP